MLRLICVFLGCDMPIQPVLSSKYNNRFTTKYVATQGSYFIVQKLSNKQSAKMICRFDRPRTAYSKSQKGHGYISIGILIGCQSIWLHSAQD